MCVRFKFMNKAWTVEAQKAILWNLFFFLNALSFIAKIYSKYSQLQLKDESHWKLRRFAISLSLSSHDFFFLFNIPICFSFLEKNCKGDSPKENPYEDVELKARNAGRKSQQLSENSLDSLHRMWSPQDRKYTTPPQVIINVLHCIRFYLDCMLSSVVFIFFLQKRSATGE